MICMCREEKSNYIINSNRYWNDSRIIDDFSNAEVKDYIKLFFEKYDPPNNIKVADLGCGAGRYTIWLAQKGFNVYACDASAGMLNRTKEGLKKIGYQDIEDKVVLSRLENLVFGDNMFDIILANGVIHNTYTVEGFLQCLKECIRVLKRDGIFYLSVFTSDTVDQRLERIDEHIYLTPDGLRMILFSKEEILQIMRDEKCQVADVCMLYNIRVETGIRSLFRATYQKKNNKHLRANI